MPDSSSASFSDSDSDGGSEDGVHASTSPSAGLNLAQLQARAKANATQARNSDPNHLARQLEDITLQYGPRATASSAPSAISSPPSVARSSTSSMAAVSYMSRGTITSSVPSSSNPVRMPALSYTSSTSRTTPSASTGRADSVIGPQYRLHQGENDVAEISEDEDEVQLECTFKFLACTAVFHDLDEWDTHCRAHFRGHMPSEATCPFEKCDWQDPSSRAGQDVWQHRFSHMKKEHEGEDFEYTSRRPDKSLLEHLRRSELVTYAEYQDLRQKGCLSERPVLNNARSRSDLRGRRR